MVLLYFTTLAGHATAAVAMCTAKTKQAVGEQEHITLTRVPVRYIADMTLSLSQHNGFIKFHFYFIFRVSYGTLV